MNIDHTVVSVLPAERRLLTPLNVEVCVFRAGVMGTAFGENVDHTAQGMLLAVQRRRAALDVEARYPLAGIMRAMLAGDAHHAILSVRFAEYRRLVPIDIECRKLLALVVKATSHTRLGVRRSVDCGSQIGLAALARCRLAAVCTPVDRGSGIDNNTF